MKQCYLLGLGWLYRDTCLNLEHKLWRQKRTRIECLTLGERKDERDMFTVVNKHKRCQWWLFHHVIQVSSSFLLNYRAKKNVRIIDTRWVRRKEKEINGVMERNREGQRTWFEWLCAIIWTKKKEGLLFLYFCTKAEVQVEETTDLHQTRLCAHKSNRSSMTCC